MNTAPESLQSVFDHMFAEISQTLAAFTPQLTPREVGAITNVSTGIARVSGLPGVGFEELLEFPGGVFGIAFNDCFMGNILIMFKPVAVNNNHLRLALQAV